MNLMCWFFGHKLYHRVYNDVTNKWCNYISPYCSRCGFNTHERGLESNIPKLVDCMQALGYWKDISRDTPEVLAARNMYLLLIKKIHDKLYERKNEKKKSLFIE